MGGDDELSESDEDAKLTMLNLILARLCRLFEALRVYLLRVLLCVFVLAIECGCGEVIGFTIMFMMT